MILEKGLYKDKTSNISYRIIEPISWENNRTTLIIGENGVGKTRFIEGVLLKKLKQDKKRILYFGQDLENQILTFELINLVKKFITTLKEQGNFFKAILFNHESHKSIELDFDNDSVLNPTKLSIKKFILKESKKYKIDILILDEVDKYFSSKSEFKEYLNSVEVERIFMISHILDNDEYHKIKLYASNGEVIIE